MIISTDSLHDEGFGCGNPWD